MKVVKKAALNSYMPNFKKYFLLYLIIILGLFLRVVSIDRFPPALNIDEAALGYNAFSILKTGADEHGRFLPLNLESFGDWKLPGYSYVDLIPIAVLGLNEFSTRLPSILAGTIGIVLIYFIAAILFKKKTIALLSAFFFSVSPWSVYFSRAAYEVNLATTFFLGGLLLLLISIENHKKRIFFPLSAFFFGLTLFTYHSFIIFTPLFLIFSGIYYRKMLKDKFYFAGLVIFILFILLSVYSNLTVSTKKFTTTTIFNNKDVIYNRIENLRGDDSPEPQLLKKIHTKYLGIPYQIAQNYISSFSPSFLFDKGGEKLVHNLNGFGNLYLFDALLLFAGISGLFYFREKSIPVLIIWLVLAPIPSALTLDAPNSTRLFMLMPLFVLTEAYGAYSLWILLRKNMIGKIIVGTLTLLFFINFIFFLDAYFVHFPIQRAKFWHYGYKQAVEVSNQYPEDKVVMRGEENFPYIYFLYYNVYDPEKFQKEASYYPITSDGFRYVKHFGRYTFVPSLSKIEEEAGVLYFDDQNFHDFDRIINLPNGDPVFRYYQKDDKH